VDTGGIRAWNRRCPACSLNTLPPPALDHGRDKQNLNEKTDLLRIRKTALSFRMDSYVLLYPELDLGKKDPKSGRKTR